MPASFAKRYRFETFIAELDAYMKANLDSFIDQMNTDFMDFALLKPASSAYYFQSLEETEIPYKVFLFYGEVGTQTKAAGPDEKNNYAIQCAIILENTNELPGVLGKRLLRYRDCLKALFNQGWNSVNKRVKIEVSGISPFPFSLTNGPATHMGIGVNLEIEIA